MASKYLKSENLTHKLLIAYCIYLENAHLRSYQNLLSQENVIENADSGFLEKKLNKGQLVQFSPRLRDNFKGQWENPQNPRLVAKKLCPL